MNQNGVSLVSDFSLVDFVDAIAEKKRAEDCCVASYDGWDCTRSAEHEGPHIAAIDNLIVGAIWEDSK